MIKSRIHKRLQPERSAKLSRSFILLPFALCGSARHRIPARPGWLEVELLLKLAGYYFALVVVEGVGR